MLSVRSLRSHSFSVRQRIIAWSLVNVVVKINVVKMTVCVAVVKSVELTVARAEVNAIKMTSLEVVVNVMKVTGLVFVVNEVKMVVFGGSSQSS